MTTSPEALREQPFERYHALASWIERLANTGAGLSLGDWMVFLSALNHALTTAEKGAEAHLAEVARLTSALQEAREALGPFAALVRAGGVGGGDHLITGTMGPAYPTTIWSSDFRRAAEVYRALSPGGAEQ